VVGVRAVSALLRRQYVQGGCPGQGDYFFFFFRSEEGPSSRGLAD